mgnify:FL=1
MNKKITAFIITFFLCFSCLLSASALTDEESVQRKRAYYAGIDSTVQLLSEHLGNLTDATVERIVVTSLQDFTNEESVKENVQYETSKLFLPGYTVEVTIQFTARENENVQDYIFDHYLPAGTIYDLTPAASSNLTTYNFNNAVSYFSDYGKSIGNGVAKLDVLRTTYYLDIDLSDYRNSGYSLSLPYTKTQAVGIPETSIVEAKAPSSAEPTTESEHKEIIPSESEITTTEKVQTAPSTPASSKTSSSSSTSSSKSTTPKAPTTAYKKVGIMVWIPTNGGKRYHSNSSCSGMINPRRVDLGEARYLGFTACGRCYR